MRVSGWVGLMLICGSVFFFLRDGKPPPLEQRQTPKRAAPRRPAPLVGQTIEIQKALRREVPSAMSRAPLPLGGERVEFEVKNGLAVAFGDILLGKVKDGQRIQKGLTKMPPSSFWESARIPYHIDADLPNRLRVERAIQYFEEHTPVRFSPFQGEVDAIVFTPGEENCYSFLGRIGGHQPIYLSDQCTWQEILHEVMHSLGFFHEHSRLDRDEYVEILWDNIDESKHLQFRKVPARLMQKVQAWRFDYSSVMLYPPQSFAKAPGLVTLKAVGNRQITPTRVGLSEGDIKRLYEVYEGL